MCRIWLLVCIYSEALVQDGSLPRNLGSQAGPDSGVGPWGRLLERSTSTFRGRLLPLRLLDHVGVTTCSERGGGQAGIGHSSQTAFQHANPQNEVTATFHLPNLTWISLLHHKFGKVQEEDAGICSSVSSYCCNTNHHSHMTPFGLQNIMWRGYKIWGEVGKCTAYTAHVYEQDMIWKERPHGPFNSARCHSIKHQNKCYCQKKWKRWKTLSLKSMFFIPVSFPTPYFHSLNSFKNSMRGVGGKKRATLCREIWIACLISFIRMKEFINFYDFRMTFTISHLQNIGSVSKCEPILLKEQCLFWIWTFSLVSKRNRLRIE